MKYCRNLILVLLLALGTYTSGAAQNHPMLSDFSVVETDEQAYLSWTIIAGSTCSGIQIYHSTDSVNFTVIGEISGVCGSVTEPQNYNFTDADPVLNSVNYYKLELGGQGFSQIISVKIIALQDGYQVQPQPANSETRIYFDNDEGQQHELSVYNTDGVKVLSSTTESNYFHVITAKLPSGVYVFTIAGPGDRRSVNGKFAVHH